MGNKALNTDLSPIGRVVENNELARQTEHVRNKEMKTYKRIYYKYDFPTMKSLEK